VRAWGVGRDVGGTLGEMGTRAARRETAGERVRYGVCDPCWGSSGAARPGTYQGVAVWGDSRVGVVVSRERYLSPCEEGVGCGVVRGGGREGACASDGWRGS